MGFNPSRIVLGVAIMLAACTLSYAVGGRGVRRASLTIGLCWTASTIGQFVLHAQWPSIVGDVVGALGLLWLAVRDNRAWQWALVALAATLLVLHALLFASTGATPPPAEVIFNNLLLVVALGVLMLAAVTDRSGQRALPNM